MFRNHHSRLLCSSKQNLLRRVPDHVVRASLPLADQLRAAGASSPSSASSQFVSPVGGRNASSLLQDWVLLAHKRPIRASTSDVSPDLNVRWEPWSAEETALISTALQLREWDPNSARAKRLRKVNTPASPAAAEAAASATPTAKAGPRTVQRARPRPKIVESAAEAAPPAAPQETEQPAAAPKPAAPRLRAKVLLRRDDDGSSPDASSDSSSPAAADDAANQEQQQQQTSTTTTVARRRVVRVGLAARS